MMRILFAAAILLALLPAAAIAQTLGPDCKALKFQIEQLPRQIGHVQPEARRASLLSAYSAWLPPAKAALAKGDEATCRASWFR